MLAQGLAGKAELQDGDAGRVVLQDVGGEHPRRHLAQSALHGCRHLGHRHVDPDVGMEVNPHHPVAVVRLRLDVFDVVHIRSECAFETGDDALFHLFRRQALVDPKDAHDGNVDVREDVDRHGDDGRPAQDGDEQGHHHECVGAAES
jgi:hypothetical protein